LRTKILEPRDYVCYFRNPYIRGPFLRGSAVLYIQVTVHRDKLRKKQPTRCIEYPTFMLS